MIIVLLVVFVILTLFSMALGMAWFVALPVAVVTTGFVWAIITIFEAVMDD